MSVSNIANTARAPESYKEKFLRRFKEEPLVPLGAAATTIALIVASTKIGKKGQSKSLNTWLRLRVVAQGFTVAAVVAGSYAYGNTKQQKDARAEHEAALAEDARVKARTEFEERLRAAEDAHALETALMRKADEMVGQEEGGALGKGKGVWGALGFGKADSLTSQDATGIPSSAPSNAPQPALPEVPISAAASEKPKSSWGWLGWSSSSDKKS